MTRITIGDTAFDFAVGASAVTPEDAYLTWANELGVPINETLQPLDGDDGCTAVVLARSALGGAPVASFATEGGFGLYEAVPSSTGNTTVTYPGVGRMYGLTTPAKIFLTFHPDEDCRAEFVKLQRAAEVTILTGRIRQYNSQTYVLNFARRTDPGRVKLILQPVDQPVPFRIFGAPSTPEATSASLSAGSISEIDLTDLPFTPIGDIRVRLSSVVVIGRSSGPGAYGRPTLGASTHLSAVTGAIPDLVSGVLGRGVGRVYGTVARKELPANTPLKRRVRLVRERDGLVIREAWSDPTTGAYDFRYVDELQTWTVIAYDYEHNYRAVVADNITPEIIT